MSSPPSNSGGLPEVDPNKKNLFFLLLFVISSKLKSYLTYICWLIGLALETATWSFY